MVFIMVFKSRSRDLARDSGQRKLTSSKPNPCGLRFAAVREDIAEQFPGVECPKKDELALKSPDRPYLVIEYRCLQQVKRSET